MEKGHSIEEDARILGKKAIAGVKEMIQKTIDQIARKYSILLKTSVTDISHL